METVRVLYESSLVETALSVNQMNCKFNKTRRIITSKLIYDTYIEYHATDKTIFMQFPMVGQIA